MSHARIDGHMPTPGQILGVLDLHAKLALTEAKEILAPLVEQEAPGELGAAMTASVRRTPTGYRASVQPPRNKHYRSGEATVAQVVRWVNRGTGLYREGPGPKKRITGRHGRLARMTLPGGKRVRSVRGQKPNPFLARAETRAAAPVQLVLQAGARRAADALRKL